MKALKLNQIFTTEIESKKITLKVIKCINGCKGCFFYELTFDQMIKKCEEYPCFWDKRKDAESVIYKEVKQ